MEPSSRAGTKLDVGSKVKREKKDEWGGGTDPTSIVWRFPLNGIILSRREGEGLDTQKVNKGSHAESMDLEDFLEVPPQLYKNKT